MRAGRSKIIDNVVTGSTFDGIALDDQAGPVTGNTVSTNQVSGGGTGIGLYGADSNKVAKNKVENNSADGLFVDETSNSNTFTSNRASGNAPYDCEDLSTGTRTAGTANTWKQNIGAAANPPGICA